VAAVAEKVIGQAEQAPAGCDLESLHRAFVPGLAGATGGGEIVRRRARLAQLPPAARPALDAFVQARLLVRDEGPDGQPQLEIAHEALLRQWPRLVEWLAQDLDALRLLDRLERAAGAWQQAGRHPELLAHRGETLTRTVEAARTPLFEQRFVEAESEPVLNYLAACEALERENKARRLESEITLAAAFFEKAQREAGQFRSLHAAALLGAALHANPHTCSAGDVNSSCEPALAARSGALAWRARSALREVLQLVPFAFERAVSVGGRNVYTRLLFHPEQPTLFVFETDQAREIDLSTGEVRPAAGMGGQPVLDVSVPEDLALLVRC
jgi:Novel STAND NTPase 1